MTNPWFQTINATDTTDLFAVISYANRVSGGIFMPIMLLVIGMIAFLGTVFSGKSVFRGMVFAGFITSILSLLMVLMNMLNNNYMYFCFLMTGIGLIGVRFSEAPS